MVLQLPKLSFLNDWPTVRDCPSLQVFNIGVGSGFPLDFLIVIDRRAARLGAHWLGQTFLVLQNSSFLLFDLICLADGLPLLLQAYWFLHFGLLFLLSHNIRTVCLKVQVIWEFNGRFFQTSGHGWWLGFRLWRFFLAPHFRLLFDLDCVLVGQHVHRIFCKIVVLLWQFVVAAMAMTRTLIRDNMEPLKLLLLPTVDNFIYALLLGPRQKGLLFDTVEVGDQPGVNPILIIVSQIV